MAKRGPKPGSPRIPGSGRKKGTPNKVTTSVKAAVFEAFLGLGGADGMQRWAQSSASAKADFYKIASKLIPAEITGAGGGPLQVEVVTYRDVEARDASEGEVTASDVTPSDAPPSEEQPS